MLLLAAVIFIFNITNYYVPVAITILILGIALAATARKG